MRLFPRRQSASERDGAIRPIQHLQVMYAYQQMTMERYNDALVQAGMAPSGNEISHSATAGITSARSIYESVIPALVAKRETFEQMGANHASFGRPAGLKQQAAYDDFGRLLAKMIERANAQYDGHIAWMGDLTSPGVDTSAFDFAERQALDVSILSLNSLIERTRLGPDGWLDINCAAFNTVRASIGLGPLNGVEFRARYFQGLAGGSARFFRD